jgi:hypothetical protein
MFLVSQFELPKSYSGLDPAKVMVVSWDDERTISHTVETYGLLPTNHFGARKQRSAEQALVFL